MFQFLAIMNKATLNIVVEVFLWTYVSFLFGKYTWEWSSGSEFYEILPNLFAKWLYHFTHF